MYIYTTNVTLCVYTVHIQYKNTTWLLFICSLFCERVAFIFDIMVFLAHRYIGETMATAAKKQNNFDGPSGRMSVCQEGIPLFEGAEHELEEWVQGFACSLNKTSDRDSTNNKHNFVSFCLSYQIISLFSSSFIFSRSHQHFSSSSYYV